MTAGSMDDAILDRWKAGAADNAIAAALHIDVKVVRNTVERGRYHKDPRAVRRGHDHGTKYSAEQIATVKRLWADGRTSRQIGSVLRVTRNVVIGLVYRLGLPKRAQRPPQLRPKQPPPNGTEIRRRVARAKLKRAYVPPPVKIAKVAPAREPRGPHVHMVDLHDECCRWPVGAWIIGEGYLFCGAPVTERKDERPYCTYHAAQAFPALKGRAAA